MAEEQQLTPEEARAALDRDRQRRMEQCSAAIDADLKAHRCAIVVQQLTITPDGRVIARPQVVALD